MLLSDIIPQGLFAQYLGFSDPQNRLQPNKDTHVPCIKLRPHIREIQVVDYIAVKLYSKYGLGSRIR